MNEKSKIITYKKENLNILWEPKKCIHAGTCVRQLPEVYNPKARPWVKPENATVEELERQIDMCPSGALSYQMSNHIDKKENNMTHVEALKGGPLLVKGDLTVKNPDGSTEVKSKQTAFCRCGHSSNAPYCDGNHRKSGFKD